MKKYNIEELAPEKRMKRFKVGKKEKKMLKEAKEMWQDYPQEDVANAELQGVDNFIVWAFTILVGSGLLVLVMGILIMLGIIK